MPLAFLRARVDGLVRSAGASAFSSGNPISMRMPGWLFSTAKR